MKTKFILQVGAILALAFASVLVLNMNPMSAGDQRPQNVQQKFEHYRQAIKDSFQIDIKNFKDSLPGGVADGKPITAYALEELLVGIKFEREHSSNSFIALEIAMDHLERVPDYYSRLHRLETEAMSHKFLEM